MRTLTIENAKIFKHNLKWILYFKKSSNMKESKGRHGTSGTWLDNQNLKNVFELETNSNEIFKENKILKKIH